VNIPANLKYTKEHEWIKVEGNIATIGITDYAQGELGDIVFVELPAVGASLTYMKAFGTIEAVKAVSDLFSPVTGKVTAINAKLDNEPMAINKDPYGEGWMIRIECSNLVELEQLLSDSDYKDVLASA